MGTGTDAGGRPDAGPDSGGDEGRLRPLAVVYVKGLCMGAADAVPGVSGGTIALLTGIYERLIGAITGVDADRLRALLAAVVSGDRARVVASLRALDAAFVAALGFGVVTALVTVASLVAEAVEARPVPTFAFFFGLIAASAVVLWRDVDVERPREYAAAGTGFLVAFLVSGGATNGLGHGPVVAFLAGTIAVSAMILPGISGSLLLLILGQYVFLTGTLRAFRDAVLALPSGGTVAAVVEPGTTAALFVAGAFVGLFTVAHLVRRALARDRRATMALLVALIVGALREPVEKVTENAPEVWSTGDVAVVAGSAVLGAAVVLGLDYVAGGEAVGLEAGPGSLPVEDGSPTDPPRADVDADVAGDDTD
jgi:putative membrane protein